MSAVYSPNEPNVPELSTALLDNLSCGIILVDRLGTLRFINRTAEGLLTVRGETIVGKRIDMLPLRSPAYKVLSESCRDFPVEVSLAGRVILVRSTVVMEGDWEADGEIYELRDITAERKERRQREEFVAMMTHDLKSPLTVILGYTQAIRHDMVDPAVGSSIEEIERSSYKLLAMIEDVMDAYRLEVGLLQVDKETCDLGTLLAACCKDFSREAEAQEVEFSASIDERIPALEADPKQLVRVFANLAGNAVKFTPRRGHVKFSAEAADGEVRVTVSDSGIGISPRDKERIFSKYYRGAGATGFKGTGLGLTISKAIVEAHGGSIDVESSEGAGSVFTVRLPVGKEP